MTLQDQVSALKDGDKSEKTHGEICMEHKQLDGSFCDKCICPELNDAKRKGVSITMAHYTGHEECGAECQAKQIIDSLNRNELKCIRPLPPEPEVGSFGLDKDNEVAQLTDDGWFYALIGSSRFTWAEIYPQIRILYSPTGEVVWKKEVVQK